MPCHDGSLEVHPYPSLWPYGQLLHYKRDLNGCSSADWILKQMAPASVTPPSSEKPSRSITPSLGSNFQDVKSRRADARHRDWAAYISSGSNRVGTLDHCSHSRSRLDHFHRCTAPTALISRSTLALRAHGHSQEDSRQSRAAASEGR